MSTHHEGSYTQEWECPAPIQTNNYTFPAHVLIEVTPADRVVSCGFLTPQGHCSLPRFNEIYPVREGRCIPLYPASVVTSLCDTTPESPITVDACIQQVVKHHEHAYLNTSDQAQELFQLVKAAVSQWDLKVNLVPLAELMNCTPTELRYVIKQAHENGILIDKAMVEEAKHVILNKDGISIIAILRELMNNYGFKLSQAALFLKQGLPLEYVEQ